MHEETPEIRRSEPRPVPEAGAARQPDAEGSSLDESLPSGSVWRGAEPGVGDDNPSERYSAARSLAWTVSNDISVAYRSGDDTVRSALVTTIGERGRIWDIELLNEALRSENPQLRFAGAAAARALLRYEPQYDDCGHMLPARRFDEPPFSVTCCALGDALYTGPIVVSREAAMALVEIGPLAGRPYIEALTIACSAVRTGVLDVALAIGVDGSRSPFPQTLEEGTKSERLVVAKALGILGREARERAARAIGAVSDQLLSKLDDPRVPEVAPAEDLMSEVSRLRREMISAVRTLSSMINDYSVDVRVEALNGLARIGPGARAARAQIGAALSDSRYKIREAAQRAEESMRG